MTEEKKQRIEAASRKHSKAVEIVYAMQSQNIARDPKGREDQRVAFDLAKAEQEEARRELELAMNLK